MTTSIEPKNNKTSLSDAVARDAPLPVKGDYILWDTKVMYFGLRVQSGGSKTWIVQKKLGRSPCRVNLGVFSKRGAVSRTGYTEARGRVAETVALINKGIDPNLEKRRQVRKTQQARQDESFSVIECFEVYIKDKVESAKPPKPRTTEDWEKTLARLKSGTLKSVSVMELTGAMLKEYYDSAAKGAKSKRASNGGRTQAALDLRYLRAAYSFCKIKYNLPVPAIDPFAALNLLSDGWYLVKPRDRIVGANEGDLKRWWLAVNALRPWSNDPSSEAKLNSQDILADYLQLSILWGGRRTETLSMRWENISLEDETVCFFEGDTKNSFEHIFPLTSHAKSLLKRRLRINEASKKPSPFIFPSMRKNKMGVRSHIVEPKATIKKVVTVSGCKFSIHDIRRTFATLLNEMGASEYSVKRALNHSAHDTASKHYLKSRIAGLRALYQQYEDKVLIEAGVMTAPAPQLVVDASDFAKFQAWLLEQETPPT